MESPRFEIVHAPFGIDHPYERLFEERRPRDPSGGEMVALGFLTRPGGLAEGVRVDWTRNGRAQAPIHARALSRGTDEDRWLVELGVVEAGDEVVYQFAGFGAGEVAVSSPEYSFVTRAWHVARRALPLDEESRYLLIDAEGRAGPAATIDRDGEAIRAEFALPAGAGAEADQDEAVDIHELFALPGGGRCRSLAVRWQVEGERLTAVELTGALGDSERLVGFGERFDALDQRGHAFDSTVYEQYKNQGNRTYLPVPFFLSSDGYGLLVEGTAPVEFDLGRTVPDRWRCLAHVPASGSVGLRTFAGEPETIVRELTAVTGRPEPLPLWAYGLWMSSNEWNTQERTEREVAETIRHEIPATVLVLEAWSDETTFYIWNGARYEPRPGPEAFSLADFTFPEDGPWPDPAGMTARLRDQGIHLVLWQIPVLKDPGAPHPQHDADVAHALERQFALLNAEGTPYRNPFFWFNNAHVPDFTNPEATDWWLAKRRYLLDEMGVEGFKTDGGEHLAGRDLRAADGSRGDELVNAFPNLYVAAYHEYAKARRGGEALTFSRAGYTGAGAYPAHWAGDENSTWEAYRRSIIAGLTAGLSGVIFWGWDIAGFSDELPTAELYLRATAMATFCPIMQYHSEYNPTGPSRDRTPWNIAAHTGDERALSLFRHFARLRMNLLPYIAREAEYAVGNGTPLMRALLLDHPEDPVAWQIADQYRFGRSLLVAPVVEPGATTRTLYLPAGRWVDLWTGEAEDGGRWVTVDAPWDRIPVFASAGSVIPLRLGESGALGSDIGNGTSLTDGLTWWLAVDPDGIEAGGDPGFGISYARASNGRLSVDVPSLEQAVRIAAPGYWTNAVAPDSRRQLVSLEPE